MLKVGLTGGIASGKTAVGHLFTALGAKVIRADDIAHELMQPGGTVYAEVVERFGGDILAADGTISRSKLAELAFGSSKSEPRIEELNRIVHPPVIQRQEEWMEQVGEHDARAIAIVEAALILEADLRKYFDTIIVVTCRPEQRVGRWAARMNIDNKSAEREIARRMAAQWPEEEKIKAANFLIDNSGSLVETEGRVREVYEHLLRDDRGPEAR